MAQAKIFGSWSFNRRLPDPFGQEADRRGKRHTAESACLSKHNHMTRGKRATLHAGTLEGVIIAANILLGNKEGAFGAQIQNGMVKRCYLEYDKAGAAAPETRLLVYDPVKGQWSGMTVSGNTFVHYPQIGEYGSAGAGLFAMLAFASVTKGILFDQEFKEAFDQFCEQIRDGYSDICAAVNIAFLLCDNLYRRVENRDSLGNEGLPFDNNSLKLGNLPMITEARLNNADFFLNKTYHGVFRVFKETELHEKPTIKTVADRYRRNHILTKEEKTFVPVFPENYEVSKETLEIVEAVCQTPMRVFMMAGEAGTGKTTSAKMAAQLLGLPYYFFTCGEATDEVDLVSSMIPNTGRSQLSGPKDFPSWKDMRMDPATALERITGTYEEDADAEYVFKKLLTSCYEQGYQCGKAEQGYVMVESSIVKGCRRPSLIEIQEPSVISKPGTLVKLNGLLDDGAAITLTNGEVVRRDPDTVIILTTNMDYRGCRGLNESVLSRMRMILYAEPLTDKEMVDRVQKRTGMGQNRLLMRMAQTVCEIQRYCRDEMITGGVCGYREYEDWVWAYQMQGDVCRAAWNTVVAKAAPGKEEREEIYKSLILTKFKMELSTAPVCPA